MSRRSEEWSADFHSGGVHTATGKGRIMLVCRFSEPQGSFLWGKKPAGRKKTIASEKKVNADGYVYVSPVFRLVVADPLKGLRFHFWVLVEGLSFSWFNSGNSSSASPTCSLGLPRKHSLLLSNNRTWPSCLCVPRSLDLEGISRPFSTFDLASRPFTLSTLTFVHVARSASWCSGLGWGASGVPQRLGSPPVCLTTLAPSSMTRPIL